jgi:hypothetical protein
LREELGQLPRPFPRLEQRQLSGHQIQGAVGHAVMSILNKK